MTSLADTLASIAAIRIVPVITIDNEARALELAHALAAGGIPCAEITLRTPAGLASIAAISSVPDFVLGAGTVITVEQVDQVADAGATFIVSPGLDERVTLHALERGLAVLPGVATATEIQSAMRLGLDVVKFFPADRLGGLTTIAALAAPFPNLRFMPSGGVGADNAADYLQHPAIFGVSGSWMAPRDAIARGDFDAIEQSSRRAAALVHA